MTTRPFTGAKAALLCGDRILVYLRDDRPGLPWRGLWDLPGGGREGAESPAACLLRELAEEFGLHLPESRLYWRREMASMQDPAAQSWFFAGWLGADEVAAIRFGDEGQEWRMMPLKDWLAHPAAVRPLQDRTALALAEGALTGVP